MSQEEMNAQEVLAELKMRMIDESPFTLPVHNLAAERWFCLPLKKKYSSKLKRQKFYVDNNNNNRGLFLSNLFTIIILLQSTLMITSYTRSSSNNNVVVDAFLVDSAPRITIQPNDLIAIEGESTELNCDAEGQPEPIIEWYHNGQLIKASTQSRTTMGGSIQFLDIRPTTTSNSQVTKQQQASTDTGIYYCLARNSLGIAKSRNASLQVACK